MRICGGGCREVKETVTMKYRKGKKESNAPMSKISRDKVRQKKRERQTFRHLDRGRWTEMVRQTDS